MKLSDGPTIDVALDELSALIHQLRRAAVAAKSRPEMSMTHLHVLVLLDAEGAVPMNRIAEGLLCSMPNATGVVDRMEERGLIERMRDDRDRRVVLVRATEAGRAALDAFESVRRAHLRRILESLSPQDRSACLRAFRAMRRAAERLPRDAVPTA